MRTRALSAVAVMLVAVGAGACGSDDDGDRDATANQAAAPTSGPAAVRAAYRDFNEAVEARDAAAACALLTAKAQKEFESYEIGKTTCRKELLNLLGHRVDKTTRPRILTIKIDGEKAIARVQPAPGRSVTGVKFERVEGEWKISGSKVVD